MQQACTAFVFGTVFLPWRLEPISISVDKKRKTYHVQKVCLNFHIQTWQKSSQKTRNNDECNPHWVFAKDEHD
jgi:hypothetical protein